MSIKVIQIHIDRGTAAHSLALASAKKSDVDLLLMGECNQKLAEAAGLQIDEKKNVSVRIPDRRQSIDEDVEIGRGNIWIKAGGINFCS